MARKKRKYIRRKPLRHDTIPMSSVVVGLLPLLLMAAVVGMYIFYQHIDFSSLSQVPEISPSISFPEITISFSEVGNILGDTSKGALEFMVSASESMVSGTKYFFFETLTVFDTLLKLILQGIGALSGSAQKSIIDAHAASAAYIQAVSWTIRDFFQYLDIPGKLKSVLDAIFWPFQFLNPAPAVNMANNKIGETNQTIGHALSPIWPIFSYIWEEFKKTANELWQNTVEAFHFLGWLMEKNNK